MNEIESPYLDNRKDWNEIVGKAKADANMWRMFGLINMFITLVSVLGMIYAAQLPDMVPFLFKEDASGGVTALGVPNQIMKVDNRIVANQLSLFVITLRQVPNSVEIRTKYVARVKAMSTAQLFHNTLAPMLKQEYATAGSGTVSVQITTVLPLDTNTWEVDWIEYKNGAPAGKFKATMNYTRNNAKYKDPSELIWNPLDIIIKDFNVNQVIGS